MACCYCEERFGRGMSRKIAYKGRYYHEECLGQYLAVRAWYDRKEQPPLPSEFTKEQRLRARRNVLRAEKKRREYVSVLGGDTKEIQLPMIFQ